MSPIKKDLSILTFLMLFLSFIASICGLFIPDVYNDPVNMIRVWQTNDLLTLCVALPILVFAVILWYRKRSQKALLAWYGILWYLCYNYAYYVYGAAFNSLYLLHLSIYSLSIAALILGLVRLPIADVRTAIKPTFARRVVIGEMLFVAAGLATIYAMQSIAYVLDGTLPPIIALSGHVTSVVFGIDVSMVVLFFVFGSVLLAKRNPWGYVIAFLSQMKGTLYMAVLLFASLRTNPAEAPLWAALGLLSLVSFVLLWVGMSNRRIAS